MAKVSVDVLGTGGTGAHFCKLLAHTMAELDIEVDLHLYDPDTIELKNMLRQPFVGSECIGTPKVEYIKKAVDNISFAASKYLGLNEMKMKTTAHFQMVTNPVDIIPMSSDTFAVPRLVVMAIDNSYTRIQFEEYLASNRERILKEYNSGNPMYFLTGGVDRDTFQLLACPAHATPQEQYDEITYPDPMLSCAADTGLARSTVQQSTHQNVVLGAFMAKAAVAFIADSIPYFETSFKGGFFFSEGDIVSKYEGKSLVKVIDNISRIRLKRKF